MKEYHDSLLAVQNILLSFKLIEESDSVLEKPKMISLMLEYLVGRRSAANEMGQSKLAP